MPASRRPSTSRTISTGDIFRANIADGTELGKQVQGDRRGGRLRPRRRSRTRSSRDRLNEADAAGGFLLDGYPRTTDQVRTSTRCSRRTGTRSTPCFELVADRDESIARLRQRADRAGPHRRHRRGRSRHRQEIYERETAPLLDVYREPWPASCAIDGLGHARRGHAAHLRGPRGPRTRAASPRRRRLTPVFRRSALQVAG